MNKLRL